MAITQIDPTREKIVDRGAAIYWRLSEITDLSVSARLDRAVADSGATRDEISFHIYGEGYDTEWVY